MITSNNSWLTVYWHDLDKQPAQRPQASLGEISLLISELALIRDEISLAYRKRDADQATRLCRYHYENFLMRTYVLRERLWDILGDIAHIQRKRTSAKICNRVLHQLSQSFPEIYSRFSQLMDLMQHDWELRKTATHNTFLHLGIVLGGIGPYDILDDVLMNYDSQAEDGRFMHKSIKTNLRGFAKEQANHIQEIILAMLELYPKLSEALSQQNDPALTLNPQRQGFLET